MNVTDPHAARSPQRIAQTAQTSPLKHHRAQSRTFALFAQHWKFNDSPLGKAFFRQVDSQYIRFVFGRNKRIAIMLKVVLFLLTRCAYRINILFNTST